MQLKKAQILLTVGVTKKVADIVVAISVPYELTDCCLKRLKFNCAEGTTLMNNSEESALAFALYETVKAKLAGSASEVFKNKVTNIECNTLGGCFVLTFQTQGTGTSLRKTCGIALSCFNTGKLFAKYSENMKFLSGKNGKKEEFNYVSKKFVESAKKSITITVVGKINLDEEKLKEIVAVLVTKIPEFTTATTKETEAPPKRTADGPETYPLIKCSGLAVAIVCDYIRNNSNGMSVGIIDEGVVIYNMGFHAKHKQLREKSRIVDYVEKKYAKLEDKHELSQIFTYYALTEGFINSAVAEKVLSSKLKTSKLIELLQKVL